jgi:hypothetical protein
VLKEMRRPTKQEFDEVLEKLEEQKVRAEEIKNHEIKVLYNEEIDAYLLIPEDDNKTTFSDAEVGVILNNVVKTDRELRHESSKINIYKYTTIILIIAILVKTFIIK